MRILLVTGTGTEIGKTVVTAAVAALALAEGLRVAVLKPAQTGVGPDEPGDVDEVRRLVGAAVGAAGAAERLTTAELARYPEPLAPATAAARSGLPPLAMDRVAAEAARLAGTHDLVLVEGAGGLLVRYDQQGTTLAELPAALRALGLDSAVLLVTAAGLGTLNTTELTAEALRARAVPLLGLVIGSWPDRPDLAAECNLADLPLVAGAPLLGALPAGCAPGGGSEAFDPAGFLRTAGSSLGQILLKIFE